MKNVVQILLIGLVNLLPFSVIANDKPNIIILLADDLGYGEIQALNPKRGKILTPNIDKLASEGIVFNDAHTSSSVCSPSRYSLLTGRYAWRTRLQKGVLTGHDTPLIDENRLTLQGMLKSQGYATALSGKWHLNFNYQIKGKNLEHPGKAKFQESAPIGSYIPDGPLSRGFDEYFGFHHARDMRTLIKNDSVIEHIDVQNMLPRTTQYAVDYIKKHGSESKPDNPFFLYVAFGSPHTPIVPTQDWIGKSGLGEYGDFVMMTDGMVGKIVDAVNKHGLKDNTLIIFSSDNGTSKAADVVSLEKQGHYPSGELRGLKSDLWDGGHRVPFIVRWPNQTKTKAIIADDLIGLTDVMATVADIIHYDLPANAAEDSVSFLTAIKQNTKSSSIRDSIIHHSILGKFSIRQGHWKLLLSPGSGGWSTPTDKQAIENSSPAVQLYNIENDIGETQNLATANPQIVESLLAILKTNIEQGRSTPGQKMLNDVAIDIWKK